MAKHAPLIINDPVYGFTEIRRGVLTDIIAHPYFQRLGRIRQLGMSALVYPGAQHTRQQHSLGAYHLMHEALRTLSEKGFFIFDSEAEAAEAAILLHDVGHGPFSHVLEQTFLPGVSHERVSLLLMERINAQLHGALSLAISIYKGETAKPFLHELISSQLDTDRLDYLCRDSFFCGVRDGNIGAARIIRMLSLKDERLVVESKGLNSVENYLMARRMMYWQVYLHKTVVAAEEVLRQALRRAKHLAAEGKRLFASPALSFFLRADAPLEAPDWLDHYAELEDNDILSAVKAWRHADDRVLALLADDFINRRLFKADVYDNGVPEGEVEHHREAIARALGLSAEEADYLVAQKEVQKELYTTEGGGIGIVDAEGTVRDLSEVSHIVRSDTAAQPDRKTYVFRQRI